MKKLTSYLFFIAISAFVTSCGNDDDGGNNNADCSKSGLSVTTSVSENDVTATATGGTSPYTYSIDNSTYVATNVFNNLQMGEHDIYVKDAKGCTAMTKATVNVFTDTRDNQTYSVVKIGNQIWMAENLNYNLPDSSWCYENSSDSCAKYGRLYNWNGAKMACPQGWHIPTQQEWETLEASVGGEAEGSKLMVGGSTGFNALLGGYYSPGANSFASVNSRGYYWSSTEAASLTDAYYRFFRAIDGVFSESALEKSRAFSVRCIKD